MINEYSKRNLDLAVADEKIRSLDSDFPHDYEILNKIAFLFGSGYNGQVKKVLKKHLPDSQEQKILQYGFKLIKMTVDDARNSHDETLLFVCGIFFFLSWLIHFNKIKLGFKSKECTQIDLEPLGTKS